MHERLVGGRVAGVDEAGRGPLAGPVVAAAVMFAEFKLPRALSGKLDDSKQLTPEDRNIAFAALRAHAQLGHLIIGVGAASVGEIDKINILQATFLAMRRAVARLPAPPDMILVDGDRPPPGLGCGVRTLDRRRWAQPVDRRGLDYCQGGARPGDGPARESLPGVWLGLERRIRHPAPPSRSSGEGPDTTPSLEFRALCPGPTPL